PHLCLFYAGGHHLHLPSFPTRRSSDLGGPSVRQPPAGAGGGPGASARNRGPMRAWRTSALQDRSDRAGHVVQVAGVQRRQADAADRKSTRLNSSHVKISYAVFCLKKKK